MAWFRHQDNTRNDKRVRELVDEFGPLGELVWLRLLEVRCQAGDEIEATLEELEHELSLRKKWRFSLDTWLKRADRLGLVQVSRKRSGRLSVVIVKWDEYQPEWTTKRAASERQRRSRARRSQRRHSDQPVTNPVTSHSTDVRTKNNNIKPERVGNVPAVSADDVAASKTNPKPLHRLIALGVTRAVASSLIEEHGEDEVVRQIEWLSRRTGIRNPAAAIVEAIRNQWEEPDADRPGRVLPWVSDVMETIEAS